MEKIQDTVPLFMVPRSGPPSDGMISMKRELKPLWLIIVTLFVPPNHATGITGF